MTIFRRLLLPLSLLLPLLCACGPSHRERLQQLEALEARNSADSLMTDDSLATVLAEFFDDHGTPNERMRAHYILGRTYADRGEAPAALEAYLDAAASADTTAADCDWAKLSRVHAQSAQLYNMYVQPRSQLEHLRLAQYNAWRGQDTIMAIECYAQTADAFALLHQPDSVVYIREKASQMYTDLCLSSSAARVLGSAITAALQCKDLKRAKSFIDIYEKSTEVVDENGTLRRNRYIYYYIKGEYYLAVNRLDSAEMQFRMLQEKGYTLNHKIAASKGLQSVYEAYKMPDSIAKYASLGYALNDSAYSLAEMENLQRMKASYDYSRNKLRAEKMDAKAKQQSERLRWLIILVVIMALAIAYVFYGYRKEKQRKLLQYQQTMQKLVRAQEQMMALHAEENQEKEHAIEILREEINSMQQIVEAYQLQRTQEKQLSADLRIQSSPVIDKFKHLIAENPPQQATTQDMRDLSAAINEIIPDFYTILSSTDLKLRRIEYDVCLLTRAFFSPAEISKLTGQSNSNVANIRKRLLKRIYGIDDSPNEFDKRIRQIG